MDAIFAPYMNDGTDVLTPNGKGYLLSLGLDIGTTEEEFLELQKVFRTELKTLEAEIETGLTGIQNICSLGCISAFLSRCSMWP